MSALVPIADMCSALAHVRLVPISDIAGLFDHLVGAGKQRRRDCDAERPGGAKIDDQFEFGRLLDRDITGLRPRKILSTYSAARRNRCGQLGP